MNRIVELLIPGSFVAFGLAGIIRPELLRNSLEEQYTRSRARIAGLVMLLLGLAGIWAILHYQGGPIDFFPT